MSYNLKTVVKLLISESKVIVTLYGGRRLEINLKQNTLMVVIIM
jgi:hypothetical protein